MHRRIFGGLALAVALLIGTPAIAMAATPTQSASQAAPVPQQGGITVPIVGTNGTNAVATITSFRLVDGVLTAVGTITGTVRTAAGLIPVTNAPFTAPVTILQQAGTCRILDLDLGPIHLDVLGLVVDLSAVHLDVTAVPGPGNLLGNLLCAIAHLLDQGNSNAVQSLINVLNRILGSL